MRKGKFLAIIVLLASIMVLLAYIVSRLDSPIATIFEPTSPTTTPTTTTATTVDEEALKRAKEEERRKLEQHIRDNTIYIAEGARIFKDTELSEEILIAEDKMSLYSLGLKDGFYEVKKDYYDTEVLGYISESFVHLSPMDFIELPEEDCEYEHVRSIPNFQENPRIKVRGVYVTIPTFLGSEYKNIVELINSTDLNAIVVDIKDDSEQLLFTSDSASKYNPAANKLASADKKDIEPLIKLAKDKGIYLIARIVTFKSPIYSKENREGIITYAGTNTPFTEDGILLWTSPMDKNLWEYNIGLAEEAIDLGFNEIQFDYVRFPTVPLSQEFFYKDLGDHSKTYAIQSFLKYAHERVNAKKAYLAADIFGWAATALDDVGIGHHWEALTNVVDYMCPMVYPSHYGPGNFGIPAPDLEPYRTIDFAIKDCISRNSNVLEPAILRPWIQYFTASYLGTYGVDYIAYGREEVQAQIQALADNGIDEYLLWNPHNAYEYDVVK